MNTFLKTNRLIIVYRKLPDSVKASAWFAICSILQKGIQFITIPMFTRIMSTEQYGMFTVYQSWNSIVTIFATLNLSCGVFNNGMLKYKDDRFGYMSSMQGLSNVATFIVIAIYAISKSFWNDLSGLPTIVILAMFLEMLFYPALSFWSMRQRYQYKYRALIVITLLISVISPAVGIFAVLNSENKGVARILALIFVNVLVGIIFYIYNLYHGKKFFDWKYWKFALCFNLPLIPHYLSMNVLSQVDRIMINHYCGETQAAIYGLSYSTAAVMSMVTGSLNASFAPWTYQECEKKQYSKIGHVSNFLLILMAGLTIIPSVLAPEVMMLLGPEEYQEGAYLIPPIAASVFFTFLYTLFGNIEFYCEESKFVMIASVTGAVLNIVLNWVFIPWMGYQVAAYTTLVCYIAFSIAHYFFMKLSCKKKGIQQNIYNGKFITILCVLVVVLSEFSMILYPYPFIRYGVLAIMLFTALAKRNDLLKLMSEIKKKK